MKMKEFGPPGGIARPWCPPLDPPLGTARLAVTDLGVTPHRPNYSHKIHRFF